MRTVEEQKQMIRNKADMFLRAVEVGTEIIPIIQQFDGKQYNKRFREALENVYGKNLVTRTKEGSVYASDSYGNFLVRYYEGYQNDITLISAETCIEGHVPKDPESERAVFDGKRIKADKMIALVKERQKELRMKANRYLSIADDLDERLKRINTLKKMYQEELNSMPYEIVYDICGLRR